MNWLISFSSTTADCVLEHVAAFSAFFVAAGIEADVLLTQQAGVRIDAKVSLGKRYRRRSSASPSRLRRSADQAESRSPPTTTPALLTGPRTFRPPMLSNLAVNWYVSAKLAGRDVADPQAPKQHAAKPMTKKPNPQIKQLATHQNPRNMNEVSTKSSARMASAEYTTVLLIVDETPSAVGVAS